jgi:hypothetical protein
VKRWFRPVAYSLILVLVALAVFADPSPEAADAFVRAGPPHAEPVATASGGVAVEATPLAAPRARGEDRFAKDLFAAPAPPPPPAPVDTATPVAAPVPELKVLGFLESDGVPQVFVELGGETAALTPGQLAGDVFRFDSIGAGMARFTYLPTGATSEYAVSDPDVAAE